MTLTTSQESEMSETAHTAGPWRVEADMRSERVGDMYAVDGYQEYLAGWNITSDAGEIVSIEWITCEDPANARLIAAAPDLLTDLIEAERMFRWYGDMHAVKPDAEKAARNYEMADRLAATIALATQAPTS